MKNLLIIGHPSENSFCYSGIFLTIKNTLKKIMKKQRLLICIEIVLLDLEKN